MNSHIRQGGARLPRIALQCGPISQFALRGKHYTWVALALVALVSMSGRALAQPAGQRRPTADRAETAAKPTAPLALPDGWTKAFQWRSIGPANMGGRVTAISVYEKEPTTFWVAFGGSGLLKTVNNGITFEHQFDREKTVAVGDVCVAPTDKNIVWVGTGEINPRNSVSWGDGVYKSTDGGKTWKNMGLKETYQIAKVIVHPTNPDIVYVGAQGRLWGANSERGVFKTTDGGKTWNKIHFIDENTGVIDMIMHPKDPDTLLVAFWDRLRDGFDSWPGDEKKKDGYDGYDPIRKWGPGGGIHKTVDGGKTWKKIVQGIPAADKGRIGLSWHAKDPTIVYAIIDGAKSGMGLPPITTYSGASAMDGPTSTRIIQVPKGSPADKAGLKVGDIVTAFGDKPVKSYNEVVEGMRPKKVGDKITLKVRRGSDEIPIEIALAARPGQAQRGPGAGGGGGGGGGGPAGARGPTDVYVGVFGADAEGGVRVTTVSESGPADKAGLEEGDIIQSLDDKKLTGNNDLQDFIRTKKVDDKIKVTFKRGEEVKTATLVVENRPGGASRTRPNSFSYGGHNQNIQDFQGGDGHEFGGIYRSDDAGDTWIRVNSLNPRPMYFSVVRVDPQNPNNVYALGVSQHISTDGGATFKDNFGNQVHADGHALWVSPTNSNHMIIGCDGGVYMTYDQGANWDHLNTTAVGQFYHVDISPRVPYSVTGGLQDNGSWSGPGISRRGGIINEDWISVGGGDGYTSRFDWSDPDIVYWTSQDGGMARRNLKTGQMTSLRPQRVRGQPPYRFNWNTPYMLSKFNPRIFYAGSQYVMRSVNRGQDLKPISPELTLTKRGSMTALAESPKNPDVLWAGTDDGALWVTKNGGKEWTNITANLGLPKATWIATIEASKFAEGRAYVAVDAHRFNDEKPYLFMTEDFGKTFKPITANLPTGSTRCLREDIKNENLLYCGTEFAFFVSLDRGLSWINLNTNLPTVAVFEIAQHPVMGDIVVATHGRSIWALDATALRQLGPNSLKADPKLYTPAVAYRWQPEPTRGRTNRRFSGQNPEPGAAIFYSLPKKPEKIDLKVVDIEGKTIRTLRPVAEAGLQVVRWDLAANIDRNDAAGGRGGFGGGMGGGGGGTRVTPPPSAEGSAEEQPPMATNPNPTTPVPTTPGAPTAPAAGNQPPAGAGNNPPRPGGAGGQNRPAGGGQGRPGAGQGGGGRQGGAAGFLPGRPAAPGSYRVVLTVDGKEYSAVVKLEADPNAPPPSAIPEDAENGTDWGTLRLPKYPF